MQLCKDDTVNTADDVISVVYVLEFKKRIRLKKLGAMCLWKVFPKWLHGRELICSYCVLDLVGWKFCGFLKASKQALSCESADNLSINSNGVLIIR